MASNGRKPCPYCGRRATEKTGRFDYECMDCTREWTDEEAREEWMEQRRERMMRDGYPGYDRRLEI